MKSKLLLAAAILALLPAQLSAQTPISVDMNRARLTWSWSQGAGGPAELFNVKCGTSSKVYTKTMSVKAPTTELAVAQAITGSGTWFCVVTASNSFGESGPSNEFPFVAGAVPSSPSALGIISGDPAARKR